MEKVRIRAGNAENNFRKVSKQVVEEKDLRAAADQRAGDLTAMLETAQQQLQDVERAKAAECKAQAARTKQAKEDSKESDEEVKADLRLQLANATQQLEKMRIRVGNAENNFRKVSKQVVEEKQTEDVQAKEAVETCTHI